MEDDHNEKKLIIYGDYYFDFLLKKRECVKKDYDLALDCFASCSVEFYMWFSKDFLFS